MILELKAKILLANQIGYQIVKWLDLKNKLMS